jgi:hypothetical protein
MPRAVFQGLTLKFPGLSDELGGQHGSLRNARKIRDLIDDFRGP